MKFNDVRVGERLSTTMYMEVVGKTTDGIKVKDNQGKEFEVRGKVLIENSFNSASQFTDEKKVSRTQAVEALLSAGDSVFTVVFDKATGEERTLVGKLIDTENQMGRSNVTDLEVVSGTNLRQVDHRTLKQVIVKGIKYIVKK